MGRLRGRLCAAALALAMPLGLFPTTAFSANDVYRDGAYQGTGNGFGGTITVEVVIQDGKISAVTSPAHAGESFWDSRNVDSLLERIVEANSPDVDGVSGATRSSDGVKAAVRDALSQAADTGIFASGDGAARNPYAIETAEQLAAFAASVDEGTTYEGEFVVLDADITLSGDWNPIGDEGSYTGDQSKLFNGSFDGQGHTVSGLSVNLSRDSELNAGLFSALNTAAQVRNVTLEGVSIRVASTADGQRVRAGGIAGATVSNSQARAAVIDSCTVSGTVEAVTSNAMGYAAGIVGQLNGGGAVVNCASDVTASGSGTGSAGRPYVGGITANNGNNSVIANCASLGSQESGGAEADGYAGGLGGMLTATVENCYAVGDTSLAGSATANAGLLIGMALTDSATLYYASDGILTVGGETVTDQPFGNNMGGASATAVSKAEMAAESFAQTLNGNLYQTYRAVAEDSLPLRQWVFEDGTVIPAGEFWVNETVDETIFRGGSGTASDPWIIQTADQLRAFAGSLSEGVDYDGSCIRLGADLDLSGETWTPVGGGEYAFEGTFDGAGHTVTGLTVGTAAEPFSADAGIRYIGLFGVLGSGARIRNVALENVEINVTAASTVYAGGIAGMIYKTSDAEDYSGAVIDGCSVTGSLTAAQEDGNCFVGGIAGYQQRGAIVNSWTDVSVSDTTRGEAIAEGGGLVGLVNRGLVANCYALGDVYASGNREDGKEGMGAPGGLISVNGGSLAGGYSGGNLTSKELSFYAGTVAGWITGIGKAYNCFYNGEAAVTVNGEAVNPVPATGTVVPGGVSEDGLAYNGGVTDKLESYTAASYAGIADTLNGYFSAYPVDIEVFGLERGALKTWTVQNGVVTFSDTAASVTYVQPEAEIVKDTAPELQDGVWYGRDENQTSVVKITVSGGEIANAEAVSGVSSGDGYNAALEEAKEKSAYGDFTHYEAADPSRFSGGSGTAADPYQIASAEQLRYLSSSVNADVTWKGVCFRQTADIDLSGGEFIPIGWAKEMKINNQWENVGYFFEGSYDGGGYAIRNLTIGNETAPAAYMAAGLFGLTNGEYVANEEPAAGQNAVTLRNIRLESVSVFIANGNQAYAGGLVGMGQNGILIDDCSVTGTVHAATEDSHCRAGGLAGSLLRGYVTDSWTNTDVRGVTEKGRVYASGLCVTNRVSLLNCYTLGATAGKAGQYNRVWVGGIDAFAGGVKFNCYSLGDVTAESGATGVGGINGLTGGISETYLCYFNSDAEQSSAGTRAETNVSTGDNFSGATDESEAKTAAELKSAEFAALLNDNRSAIVSRLNERKSELGYPVYYSGDGSDLRQWELSGGVVGFAAAYSGGTGDDGPWVLMNIPYADFYRAELNADSPAVDAVTSASKRKPLNPNLANGSYHVNSDGSDISGVIYPVYLPDASVLNSLRKVTDPADLFGSPAFTYSPLAEQPAQYKECRESGGAFTFSEARGNTVSTVSGVVGEVKALPGRHTDIEIKLTGTEGIETGAAVSGVILTDSDGMKYGLRHIANIWRATELGWNLGELDLSGKTITNIRYITQTAVYDYPVEVSIPGNGGWVLMNIPYADFYKAELNEDSPTVDAVTSATKNKPRTGGLAGGSYHVNSDGSDISGVIYPVFVPDLSALADRTRITDDSGVSITVTNRGQESTTEYAGQDALFESADYSYYLLNERPTRYKVLSVDADGALSFGAVSGRASTVNDVTGVTVVGGRHADIEIALSGTEGIETGAAVSGVILTDSDGAKYGLRHIVNIWRATELGWNLGELDLNGKTIANIRYITRTAVYDYPVELVIGNPGYVLMNIPYEDFYQAELDGGSVDAVTKATLKFENRSVAAGSYHVNDSATDEDCDITGVTWPVFVSDLSALDANLEVRAADKKTINLVTGREKTLTATEVEGQDILFCSPSYSWYRLDEKPARYKTLTVEETGAFTFGAVSGRASAVNDVSAIIRYDTHHGNDAEVILNGTGISADAVTGGVILTDSDGVKYGLRHVEGIWSRTQIGWNSTADIGGKTFTNVRFILRDSVIDCPVNFTVKPKLNASITAAFAGTRELSLTGLAADMRNLLVTVTYITGTRPDAVTHTVAENAVVSGGRVTLSEDVIPGQAYTVSIVSDNYADISLSNVIREGTEPTPVPTATPTPALTPVPTVTTAPTPTPGGGTGSKQGCYVATAVYGSYDCPEVWTLRRFRDDVLAETWYGRLFIRLYYTVSPTAVKLFGENEWFQNFWRARLDTMVSGLQSDGFASTPYADRDW